MKYVILFLFCFVSTVSANPRPIKVFLVNAVGENSLSEDKVFELFDIAADFYLRELNIDLKLVRYRRMRNPYRQDLSDNQRIRVLRRWEGYFKRRRHTNKSTLKFALMNPIKDGGVFWLAGYANGTCAYRRLNPVAYSNGEPINSSGIPRFLHSIVAFLHETLHLLGASHDSSLPPTIMHPAPLPYVDQYGILPLSINTKKQVEKCLK